MSTTHAAHIPVFMSRHQETVAPFEEGYGAFIDWQPDERVTLLSKRHPPTGATVQSGIKSHADAPNINSAYGFGPYVVEVIVDGEGPSPFAVSAALLTLPRPEHAAGTRRNG